jgi:type III restriction enzyme
MPFEKRQRKYCSVFSIVFIYHQTNWLKIKAPLRPENCLLPMKEAEANDKKLNTLEDANNPTRAIFFAVQNSIVNVLNLFDIVRLYEGQKIRVDPQNIRKTTAAEAHS